MMANRAETGDMAQAFATTDGVPSDVIDSSICPGCEQIGTLRTTSDDYEAKLSCFDCDWVGE